MAKDGKAVKGEHPDHIVVIKYVPAVGDSKRAIDEYYSEIMGGGRSTISIFNECEVRDPFRLPLASSETDPFSILSVGLPPRHSFDLGLDHSRRAPHSYSVPSRRRQRRPERFQASLPRTELALVHAQGAARQAWYVSPIYFLDFHT